MKSPLAISTVVVLLCVSVEAQEKAKLELFGGAGLGFPLAPEPFKEAWKEGYGISGGVAYRFNPRLSIRGRIDYDRLSFDIEGFRKLLDPDDLFPDLDFQVEGGDVSILSFVGEAKFSFLGDERRVSPYVIGGGGVARVSSSDSTITMPYLDPRFFRQSQTVEGEMETSPLATFGGGADIELSKRIAAFVEGRYQRIFTEEEATDIASVKAGIRIRF